MSQIPFPPSDGSHTEPPVQPSSPVDQPIAEPLLPAMELPINDTPFGASPTRLSGRGPAPGRRLVSPQEAAASNRKLTPEQELLILDTWQRSGLPANDFAALVGVNRITLYAWKKRFDELGPAGLTDQPRKQGSAGKIPELTKRAILMLKKANPQWGCQRISDVLYRGPGLPAQPNIGVFSEQTSAWNELGFGYVHRNGVEASVIVPYWAVTVGLGLVSGSLIVRWHRRRRYGAGLCSKCGYDLRATGDCCPECGTLVTKPADVT